MTDAHVFLWVSQSRVKQYAYMWQRKVNKQSLYSFINVHINGLIIHSPHVAIQISVCNLLYSCTDTFTNILPPKAYCHGSCDKSPHKPPQREDGDNNCPDQSHLVVLQLDLPSLQECLIYKGLNKLWEEIRQSHSLSLTELTKQSSGIKLTLITCEVLLFVCLSCVSTINRCLLQMKVCASRISF